MSNKTCKNCKHYLAEMFHCQKNDVMAEAHNTCEDFKPKIITNGDKIRQMSNARLAGLIAHRAECIGGAIGLADCPFEQINCAKCWETWLNAPAESEGKDE